MDKVTQCFPLSERLRIAGSLVAPAALLWLACRRGWLPWPAWWFSVAIPLSMFLGILVPQAFTVWYRLFSAIQSWIGQWLVTLLLALVFVLVLVPVGLILRLCGKSFLERSPAATYWKPARPPGSLKQQF
ncbi:MAG TPA: SxtJ family membrane protein [Verrucomicrobiota bacterium]|nr:hypothetical protein [Verrucomicrobiales bacterium]HRI15717.1 SxtJ family membrane protein [Verrucomicrobiota bacterium]